MNPLLPTLTQVLAIGGGAAGVAFLIFRFLGKSWIENKFAQSLDRHRHAQALEIQRLHIEIDALLSGTLKIQEKEYETLPEAWFRLDEAYGNVSNLVSRLQTYTNLDGLPPVKLEEFLAESKLTPSQKDDVRQSNTKTNTYQDIVFWYRLSAVKKTVADLHNYVARNGIFFPPELKSQFTEVSKHLWSAIIDKEIGVEDKDRKIQGEAWTNIKEKVDPLYRSIESGIYVRLQAHGKGVAAPETDMNRVR